MRIALVRGPHFNPWELQSFEPLARRHNITVFLSDDCPHWDNRPTSLTIVRLGRWNSLLARLHRQAPRLWNGVTSRLLGHSWRLPSLEERLKPFEIIHALESHNSFSAQSAAARRRYQSRLVLTIWETIAHRGESHPSRTKAKRATMAATDAFIAVTERTARMLREEGVSPNKIHVQPMGIDLTHFKPRPPSAEWLQRFRKTPDEFLMLSVARLVSEKGVHDLLDAFITLCQENASGRYRLVFAGRGPEESSLKERARSAGVEERVIFAGQIPYDAIPDIYSVADCFVLASRPTAVWEEQFGYCLVEAMAMGRCIVAADSGAIAHVVGDAGSLVPHSNPAALKEAVLRLRLNPALRDELSQRALQRAAREYDGNVVADRLEAIYRRLYE